MIHKTAGNNFQVLAGSASFLLASYCLGKPVLFINTRKRVVVILVLADNLANERTSVSNLKCFESKYLIKVAVLPLLGPIGLMRVFGLQQTFSIYILRCRWRRVCSRKRFGKRSLQAT